MLFFYALELAFVAKLTNIVRHKLTNRNEYVLQVLDLSWFIS
jgi:hypothetical protein